MKNFLLTLFTPLIALGASAQMTMTFQSHSYPTGTFDAYVGENQTIDTVSVGANVSWDFSNLTVTQSVSVDVDTAMNATFPDANLELDNGVVQYYYRQNEDGMSLVGAHQQGIDIIYDDYMDVLHFPFTYGDQFTDTASGYYEATGVLFTKDGSIHAECDAYGQVEMPFGMVDDVLRIKMQSTFVDSNTTNNVLTISRNTAYAFYSINFRTAIAQYSVGEIEQLGQVYPFESIEFQIDSTFFNSVDEQLVELSQVNIYPNPSADYVRVDLGDLQDVDLSIVDLQGRRLKTIQGYISDDMITVGDLPRGTYLIQLSKDNHSWNKLLILE